MPHKICESERLASWQRWLLVITRANYKPQQESQQQKQYGSVLQSNAEDCSKADQTSYRHAHQVQAELRAATAERGTAGCGNVRSNIRGSGCSRVYLARWSGFSKFESLYAQLVGSAILGVISAHKQVQNFFRSLSLSLM